MKSDGRAVVSAEARWHSAGNGRRWHLASSDEVGINTAEIRAEAEPGVHWTTYRLATAVQCYILRYPHTSRHFPGSPPNRLVMWLRSRLSIGHKRGSIMSTQVRMIGYTAVCLVGFLGGRMLTRGEWLPGTLLFLGAVCIQGVVWYFRQEGQRTGGTLER